MALGEGQILGANAASGVSAEYQYRAAQVGGNAAGAGKALPPREQSYMDGLDSRLSNIRALAAGNNVRLQEMLDRVYGADASKLEGTEIPLAAGISSAVASKAGDLQDILERQRALIERLERFA